MTNPGRFRALWMSFYSADVYRAAARHWRGIGFWYLVLLLAWSWLPSLARGSLAVNRELSGDRVTQLMKQLPTVIIENGVMRADPPGRHEIRFPETATEALLLIIDGTIDEVPSEAESDTIVLTRRELGSVRPSRSQRRAYAPGPAADMHVTPEDASGFLQGMGVLLPPIGYAGAFLTSLSVRLVQLLVYGAVGYMFVRMRNLDLTFGTLLRLSAVAMTPWVVIRTLVWFGPWEPDWYLRWPIAIAITLAYLAFGIRAAGERT